MSGETDRALIAVLIFIGVVAVLSYISWLYNPMARHMGMMGMGGFSFPSYSLIFGVLVVLIYLVLTSEKEGGDERGERRENRDLVDVVEKVMDKDESLIINIIREHEGITQDSLRFKTGFSKAKISLILKELENKGIIYRERFGKTYRLYIGDWLKEK